MFFLSQSWTNERVENEMDLVESTVKSLRSLAKERRDRYVEVTFSFVLQFSALFSLYMWKTGTFFWVDKEKSLINEDKKSSYGN